MTAEPTFFAYFATPFNSGTQIHEIDVFAGNGVDKEWALVFKNGLQVGNSAQVDNNFYPRDNGQLIVDGNNVILPSAPITGQTVIIPGQKSALFPVSDQNDAIGRTVTIPLYFGDVGTPQFYRYKKVPGQSGIRLQMVDVMSASGGSDPSWFQFAPALADGSQGTLLSAGAALYTANLEGNDSLASPASIGDGTITLNDASLFVPGDFLMLDVGNGSQETLKISTISGNVCTVPALVGVNHLAGANVLSVARKFYLKITVPLNAAGGIPKNLYNTVLTRYVYIVAST